MLLLSQHISACFVKTNTPHDSYRKRKSVNLNKMSHWTNEMKRNGKLGWLSVRNIHVQIYISYGLWKEELKYTYTDWLWQLHLMLLCACLKATICDYVIVVCAHFQETVFPCKQNIVLWQNYRSLLSCRNTVLQSIHHPLPAPTTWGRLQETSQSIQLT